MGTTDRDSNCGTCGCNYIECPGHFGHIKLKQAVYHPGYVTFIRKVLRCICESCGKLRLRGVDLAYRNKMAKSSARTRFRRVFEACKDIKTCSKEPYHDGTAGCGRLQPSYSQKALSITTIRKGDQDAQGQADPRGPLKADDAYNMLSRIKDEDLVLMGLDPKQSRPEWMIISVLAVAPPPVRPSV